MTTRAQRRTRIQDWFSGSFKPSAKSSLSDAVTKRTTEPTLAQTQEILGSTLSSKSIESDKRTKENQLGLIRLTGEHADRSPSASSGNRSCPVDIVAVHGLDGGTYTTFTAENGAYWLADFLPHEFPGARIYTFGYPSDVFLSLGTGDFESWARNLLESLAFERSASDYKRRPLLFICHSMGGIVVKKALNISVVEPERYQDIRKSVEAGAIFFMATPHRGSRIAGLGSISATIANLALRGTSRYKGRARSELVKSLKKGSKELQVIGRDFRNQTGSINFYSFIEDETIFPSSERIVDDESGSINVKNETIIPMTGSNHRNICRFAHKEDHGYKLVLGHLRSTVEASTALIVGEITSEDQSCLQSLAFSSMTDRYDEVSQRHPNTCDWIFTHPKFCTWIESDCGLLWIKGHPGTGKSTLMASVYSRLRLSKFSPQYICLRFFFHGNGTLLQKSQLGLFRSLLHQVYRQSLSAKNTILAAFQEKSRSLTSNSGWNLGELKELFLKITMQCSKQKEILIFVDALDEAVDEGEQKLAEVLLDYFHRLHDQIRAERGKAKICISCRHYPQIKVNDALQLSVEQENEDDLRRFVADQLEDHVLGWHEETRTVQAALVEAIVQRAAGQFLWASIRVPQVTQSLNDGIRTFEDIHEILDSESSELSAIYVNVLISNVQVSMRPKALLLLQWICFAERPLSPRELRCAMACDSTVFRPGQNSCDESAGYVKSDVQMKKLTKSLTGGLAVVKHGYSGESVQFIHQSVTDFVKTQGLHLFCSTLEARTSWSCIKAIGVSEERLATTCLNYLTLGAVLNAIKFWSEEDEKGLPFLRYATNHWTAHAERAEENECKQVGKVDMFDTYPDLLLSWVKIHKILNPYSLENPGSGSSFIHTASRFNLLSVVQYLLQRGTSAMERDHNGWTPLNYAVDGGHSSIVRTLIQEGADVKATDVDGQTPMSMVVRKANFEIVLQLLNGGAAIDDPVGEFGSVLQEAAFAGKVGLTERLIDIGASVSICEGGFGTALQSAAVGGHAMIVKLLIARGANVNASAGSFGGALQCVLECAHPTVAFTCARILVENGADVNLNAGGRGNPLQGAAKRPDVEIVEYLLQQGAHVNAKGGEYGSALQAAASKACPKTLRLLLDNGAEVNANGGTWGTALQGAAAYDFENQATEAVQILLGAGADIFAQGDGRWGNALIAAAWGGNLQLVKLFLSAGIDVNYPGKKFGTALQAATNTVHRPFSLSPITKRFIRNNEEILKVLRAHGATMAADNKGVAE